MTGDKSVLLIGLDPALIDFSKRCVPVRSGLAITHSALDIFPQRR